MNAPDSPGHKRRRRLSNRLLALILLFLVLAALAIALTRRPDFYRDISERDDVRAVAEANRFNQKAAYFYSERTGTGRFEVEFTADEVNGALAAAGDDALWQMLSIRFEDQRKALRTEALENVQVSFRACPETGRGNARICAAGEMRVAGVPVVVSVCGRVHLADGQARIEIESVHAGAVPVPKSFLAGVLGRIEGRPFPENTKKWRIHDVEIADGRLRLDIEGRRRD